MLRSICFTFLVTFFASETLANEKDFRAKLREISWTVNVRKADGKLACRGSCTLLMDDKGGTWALGCNHCIEDAVADPALSITVSKPIFENGMRVGSVEYKAEVAIHSAAYDLALMKVAKTGIAFEITLGGLAPMDIDEDVWCCGTQHGDYDQRISKGVVQGHNYQIKPGAGFCDGADFLVYPGSSGGGIFNAKGELVGICSWMHGNNCSFFVPTRQILKWISNDGQQYGVIFGTKPKDNEVLPQPRVK